MSVEDDMAAECKRMRTSGETPCGGRLRLIEEYLQSGSRAEITADASHGCRRGCVCQDPQSWIERRTVDGKQVEYIVSVCQQQNTGNDPNSHVLGRQLHQE